MTNKTIALFSSRDSDQAQFLPQYIQIRPKGLIATRVYDDIEARGRPVAEISVSSPHAISVCARSVEKRKVTFTFRKSANNNIHSLNWV